jgi:hypothetical protein
VILGVLQHGEVRSKLSTIFQKSMNLQGFHQSCEFFAVSLSVIVKH